jgi:hypothetical protein
MAEIRTVELNVETNSQDAASEFERLKTEIQNAQQELDSLTQELGASAKATVQAQKKVNDLSAAYDQLNQSATNVDGTFAEIYGETLQPLTTRLGEAEDRLYELALAGKQNTQEYKELMAAANNYLRTQQQVDLQVDAGAQTMGQKMTMAVGGLTGAYGIAEGATALFGVESKKLQETMVKLQAVMTITSSIVAFQEAIPTFKAMGKAAKESAVGVALLNAAQTVGTFVTGAATAGLKAFRIALVSTGVGALVVGVGLLIANFDKVIKLFTPLINGFKMFSDWIGVTNFKQQQADAIALRGANNRIKQLEREKEMREKLQGMKQRAFDAEDKAYSRQIALMKAQGKDTTDLERQRLKATIRYQTSLQNETYALWVQNREKNKLILSELHAIAVREKKYGEYNEKLKIFTDAQNELARENAAANQARLDAVNDLAIFEAEVLKSRSEAQSQSVQTTQTTEKQKYDLEKENRDKRIALMAEGYAKEKALSEARAKDAKDDLDKRNKEGIIKKKEYAEAEKLIQQTLDKELLDLQKKYFDLTIENNKKAEETQLNDSISTREKELSFMEESYNKERLTAKLNFDKEQNDLNNKLDTNAITREEYDKLTLANSQKFYDTLRIIDKKSLDENLANREKAKLLAMDEEQRAEYESQKSFNDELKDLEKLKQKGAFESEEEYLNAVDILRDKYNEKEKERKAELYSATAQMAADALDLVASIAEENAGKDLKRQKRAFNIRKAANLAQASIDGTKAVLSTYADTPGDPIIKGIAATIAGGFAVLKIAQIAKSKFEGGGGGNDLTQAPSASTSMVAQFNTVGSSGINQLAQLQQQPVQAYVVSGEVTSAQALDRNRVQNATL